MSTIFIVMAIKLMTLEPTKMALNVQKRNVSAAAVKLATIQLASVRPVYTHPATRPARSPSAWRSTSLLFIHIRLILRATGGRALLDGINIFVAPIPSSGYGAKSCGLGVSSTGAPRRTKLICCEGLLFFN